MSAGDNAPLVEQNQVLYKSPIGTPVFSDLDITGDSYTINGQTFTFNSVRIPSAIFKVEREHRVVRTEVNGEDGEILEYIGTKNWEIDCDIKLSTGKSLLYPAEEVQNLITLLGSNQVLAVNSWYLNQFKITNIVILHEYEPQVEGALDNQHISFRALSVKPLIITQAQGINIYTTGGDKISAGEGTTAPNIA